MKIYDLDIFQHLQTEEEVAELVAVSKETTVPGHQEHVLQIANQAREKIAQKAS